MPSSPAKAKGNGDVLPRVDFDRTEIVGSTRWMRLETLSYHVPPDADGDCGNNLRKWDRAVRTTKRSEDSVDAVAILAVLRNDPSDTTKDEVVCVKQFRPPLDGYTIELPAGLVDPNEDPARAAEREFEEETGYIGKAVEVLPASFLSPGLTNESACFVRLEVDMSQTHNMKIHNNQIENSGLEGCEKDRGLEKLLLPRMGLLAALHDLQEKEGVKVFAALYSLALGMSLGESVTSALCESGFLIVRTSLLPLELQQRALEAASTFLQSSSYNVVMHPSDPKIYAMFQGVEAINNTCMDDAKITEDLKEWYHALRKVRMMLLRCIAVGLGMADDPDFFAKQHDEDEDAMRLLKYLPGDELTGNRCKEHSDYGTLTLLLTDGVCGLEAFVGGRWRPVPHAEGGIIVNIGSILSEWTRQELKATLHRVAGPRSCGSMLSKGDLLRAVTVDSLLC